MIGILVCGHGKFASGIYDAVNLLAGRPQQFEYVDFLQEDSVDDLEEKLKKSLDNLKNSDGIIIFTDLIGGATYKCALNLAKKYDDNKVIVISGTNLAMLIETTMSRVLVKDVDDLSEMAINIGKDQIVKV